MLRVADHFERSDTGRARRENEDSFYARSPMFAVADGMGGAQAGEVASKAAADSFDRDLPEGPPERFLRETIEEANRRIHTKAQDDRELDAWIAAHLTTSAHLCGSARLGQADDPDAVVDPDCRVIGVDALRVVDAAVIPHVPRSNTNVAVTALAERIAERW